MGHQGQMCITGDVAWGHFALPATSGRWHRVCSRSGSLLALESCSLAWGLHDFSPFLCACKAGGNG